MKGLVLVLFTFIYCFFVSAGKSVKQTRRMILKSRSANDCIVAAEKLGDLLEIAGPDMGDEMSNVLHNIFPDVFHFDLFDASDRENVLCAFTGESSFLFQRFH